MVREWRIQCDRGSWLRLLMSVVMSSIPCSTVNCNTTMLHVRIAAMSKEGKSFMEILYYCSLLCYVKCLASLLTAENTWMKGLRARVRGLVGEK